tara:strand:+ start:85 stop:1275 length:1191 start_codon:yes stop_codon:yes gene_type:complete
MKQEKVEEGEVKEEKKERVAYTGPTLPEGVVPEDNSKQGVIKQGKAPAWYENLFQSDNKGRELSGKEKKEEKYALPSTPTWSKFENSKVGKSIDAKGIVKEKDGLMNLLGYGKGEEKDLALDATAVAFPAADVVHATTKLAEGKYLDAGLYALFAAVPGAAGPLVNKAKKLLGVGDKAGAEKLLKETIKNNENAIKTNLKPKGGVDGGSKNIIGGNEYYKGATHRGTITDIKQFDNTIADATNTVGRQGKATDNALAEMNFNVATDLKPEHVKKVGTQSGRDIFEVSYPDGTTQKFWQSSGGGGKTVMYKGKEVSSEGFFGTVAGHMDNKLPVNQATSRADEMYKRGTKEHAQMTDALTDNEGYFIKSNGWQGYGSSTYEQTGASLKEMFEKGLIK